MKVRLSSSPTSLPCFLSAEEHTSPLFTNQPDNEKLLSMMPYQILVTPLQSLPPDNDTLLPSLQGLQLGLGCPGCQGDQSTPEEQKRRESCVGIQREEGYVAEGWSLQKEI